MTFTLEADTKKKKKIMVTFDITDIYISIPNDLVRQTNLFSIEKYPGKLHLILKKRFVTDDIELIMTNNHFQINNKKYTQTQLT